MKIKEIDLYLKKVYYFLDLPSSYASKNTFYQAARVKFPEVKLNQVENWLSKQLSHTLHKPLYKTFQTRPVIVYAIDELWQLDLSKLDLSKLARENDGHNSYCLLLMSYLSMVGFYP